MQETSEPDGTATEMKSKIVTVVIIVGVDNERKTEGKEI